MSPPSCSSLHHYIHHGIPSPACSPQAQTNYQVHLSMAGVPYGTLQGIRDWSRWPLTITVTNMHISASGLEVPLLPCSLWSSIHSVSGTRRGEQIDKWDTYPRNHSKRTPYKGKFLSYSPKNTHLKHVVLLRIECSNLYTQNNKTWLWYYILCFFHY